MTKTKFRKLSVEDMRNLMLEVFEDPDGELATMNKRDMTQLAMTNWSVLKDYFDSGGGIPEPPEDEEEEEEVEPSTDLCIGPRHDHSTHLHGPPKPKNTDLA